MERDVRNGLKLKSLRAEEICSILHACKETGVAVLKFHDLEVTFGNPLPQDAFKPEIDAPLTFPDAAMSEAENKKHIAELLQEEAQAKLDQMQIEDPVGYERALLSGELEDAEPHDRPTE